MIKNSVSSVATSTTAVSNDNSNLEEELIFFLGAIFYPKHLKKCYASNNKKKLEIDEIHRSLYKFTIYRLSTLEFYGAYHFLLQDFMINHKAQILLKEQNKTEKKAKTDFNLGFEQIQNRLNTRFNVHHCKNTKTNH